MPATAVEYERPVVREEGRFEREPRPAEHVVLDVQALLADGEFGPDTLGAVVRYQEASGLASGELTMETLGIEPWRDAGCAGRGARAAPQISPRSRSM